MIQAKEKLICCIIAVILFFSGMCLEVIETDSFFAYGMNETDATIYSADYIEDTLAICTVDMLRGGASVIRGSMSESDARWQSKVLLMSLFGGLFLQYLLGRLMQAGAYQSEEFKEDGQLFLCWGVAVNYIHQKDGEK